MYDTTIPGSRTHKTYRIAVAFLFFLQGLCFATWASRIPSIQQMLQLSDAALGLVLLALPAGSMAGLPLAGWLVTKLGSRRLAANALVLYSMVLLVLGLVPSTAVLIAALVLFGVAGNVANIAINTQAVGVEALYGRNIMASGAWRVFAQPAPAP